MERALAMVDGVLLLVDASEGPLPQTRFVLRKALEARLPVIVVVNKVDRTDARVSEVVHEVEELFLDLDADEDQIGFPVLYANARAGRAGTRPMRSATTSRPCSTPSSRRCRLPRTTPTSPCRLWSRNLDASPYLGRLAICRVHNGTLRRGDTVAWCRIGGAVERAKVTELFTAVALERVSRRIGGARRDRGGRRLRRCDHRRDPG